MPHYDGPAFQRSHHPNREPDRPKHLGRGIAPAPAASGANSNDYHVDPLEALATPASVVTHRRQPVDYAKIKANLTVRPERLFVLAPAAAAVPWAQAALKPAPTSAADSQRTEPDPSASAAMPAASTAAATAGSAPAVAPATSAAASATASTVAMTSTSALAASTAATTPSALAQSLTASAAGSASALVSAAVSASAHATALTSQAIADRPADQPAEPAAETAVVTSATAERTATSAPVSAAAPPQLTDAAAVQQAALDAQISKHAAAVASEEGRPATLTELVETSRQEPAPAPTPHHHSTRPNPLAVRASVRHYLQQKKAAAKAAKQGRTSAESSAQSAPQASQAAGPKPDGAAAAASTAPPTGQPASPPAAYQLPPLSLLADPVQVDTAAQQAWVAKQRQTLDDALASFHVDAQVVASTVGPTVTQFQVKLAPGVKVNKITNLTDDLKMALAARDIRIEAPIPGKNTVGIEIPNRKARPVMLKEVLGAPVFQQAHSPLTVALGVDLFGKPVVTNLAKMPHGLIAGATGAGKSVFINSLITSLLYKATPREVRLLLIDPKAVELAVYNGLPHLVAPVVSDAKAAAAALKWAVGEMERRYEKMAAANVRSLAQFNEKARAHGQDAQVMPSIVIIIDELADLMMVAASEVQDYIARITAKARAAGIHLIVATQRPSVDVITGTIKNNIPTRIAFMVASQVDSRTIIDRAGAETLLGRGDMLFLGNGASQPMRLQGTFIDRELDAVTDFVRRQQPPQYLFDPGRLVAKAQAMEAQDDLFPQVLSYVASESTVSTSQLQRKFAIGYNRAAKLIDELEMRHYVSPANGSKPRDVYLNKEDLPQPKSERG